MNTTSAAVVLPARYHSTRFPGKPLALIAGKPLIEWVCKRASTIEGVSRVVVATDDDRIVKAVEQFGGDVVMTSPDHATGTDRVASVAKSIDEDIIVNLQGDEPVFPPALVREMIDVLADRSIDIVTACHPIRDVAEIANPNVVKVVADLMGRALYFSRSAIPAPTAHPSGEGVGVQRHVGIYVFRKQKLVEFGQLARTPLERAENLEQLRALENGMTIKVVQTEHATLGVDVPEDLKSVEKALVTN